MPSTYYDGYKITANGYGCTAVGDEVIYFQISQDKVEILTSGKDLREISQERICLQRKAKEISLYFEEWTEGACGAISWMDGDKREKYSECNSYFFKADTSETLLGNLIGCALLGCIQILGGYHVKTFQIDSFLETLKLLEIVDPGALFKQKKIIENRLKNASDNKNDQLILEENIDDLEIQLNLFLNQIINSSNKDQDNYYDYYRQYFSELEALKKSK